MQFNNRLNCAYDGDEFTETTGVYDAAFLGLSQAELASPVESGARLYPGARQADPSDIVEAVGRQAAAVQRCEFVLPTRFEKGEHMESYLVGEMPMAVGLFSNASFSDLQPGQQAALGVSAARLANDRIDFTLLNFEINSAEQRKALPELLLHSRRSGTFEHDLMPDKQVGRLKMTIDLGKRTINSTADASASRCFLVRGRHVYEIGGLTDGQELKSGDVILAMTPGLLNEMARQVTRKAYANVVPALHSPSEEAMEDLPDDFVQQEAANQILGLIKSSQIEARILRDELSVIEPKLSPQKLLNSLSTIFKRKNSNDPATKIVTEAFVAYQVP